MRLHLLGSKQSVKGFDIDAHAKFVQGAMHKGIEQDNDDDDNNN